MKTNEGLEAEMHAVVISVLNGASRSGRLSPEKYATLPIGWTPERVCRLWIIQIPVIEPRFLGGPHPSLVTVPTELSQFITPGVYYVICFTYVSHL